jgi:hypothetical protein
MRTRLIALSVAAALVAGSFAGAAALALSITPDEPVVTAPSGHQSASAPASHAMICGGTELGKVPPGASVHIALRLGNNRAVLEGVAARKGDGAFAPRLMHARVVVHDAGEAPRTFGVRPVADGPGAGVLLGAGAAARDRSAVFCIARFGSDAHAVVALSTTSGFDQCCTDLTVYPGQVGGVLARHGGPGEWPVLVVKDHRAVIRRVDTRFWGVFTDLADSALPLQFSTAAGGRLVDATQSYLPAVSRDAAMWWREFVKPHNGPHHGLSALAAWVADEYVLRHGSSAWAKVEQLERAGKLRGLSGEVHGGAYVRELRAFLIKTGYAT